MIKKPYLVQKCVLDGSNLRYEYMGAAEFEVGDQVVSLRRIFEKGMTWGTVTITSHDQEIVVHMVAANGFPFEEYQKYLQLMGENRLHLKEWSQFDAVISAQIPSVIHRFMPRTNVWFDFENDVLWCLDKSKRKALVHVLGGVKRKWSQK